MSIKSGVLKMSSLNVTGFCSACGKKSESKCDRCGDFYCSEECQRRDWPGHRYICFPMPQLVKVGQCLINNDTHDKSIQPQQRTKNENFSSKENQLPNGSCVLLVSFKSTNRCFVHSTNPSAVAEREKFLNDINEFGMQSSPLSELPKNNTRALALRNEKWCRVHVLGRFDNGFRVNFIDFGDTATKQLNQFRKSSDLIINLPCSIYKVTLKCIKDFSTRRNALSTLEKYVNKEYKIQYVTPDNWGGNVELFQWGTAISLNSLIREVYIKDKANIDIDKQPVGSSSSSRMSEKKAENIRQNISNASAGTTLNGTPDDRKLPNEVSKQKNIGNSWQTPKPEVEKVSSVPRQIQLQTPCLIPPFKIIPLNKSDHSSKILIMDNSYIGTGFIGCLLEKYCENLKAVTKFLNEVDVGHVPYKPKAAEYCLAKFDNMWYRAKVVEIISDDKFLVVYIDFTNEMELCSDSIRRYPLPLDLPCCTTLCGIDGLPDELSEELKTFLEENLASFSVLNIDTIRMEDNICYLKSDELLNKLRNSKLL